MKIVLDAGHGYNTAGKRTPDDSMREWEFNNGVAKYAREMLLKYQDVEVIFTHDETGKVDVSLKERTDKANKLKADVFCSIHANANGSVWNDAHGIETFVYETKPKLAVELATKVQDNLIKLTGLSNRGVKSENFHVIREAKMTAILVECGFMSNRKEAELLKSESYRKTCAKAIVEGLVAQYKLILKPVAKPVEKPVVKKEVKVEGGRKMNLTNTQLNVLAQVYQNAYEQGILTSNDWSDKAKNGQLTVDEAIYINAIIVGRTVLK